MITNILVRYDTTSLMMQWQWTWGEILIRATKSGHGIEHSNIVYLEFFLDCHKIDRSETLLDEFRIHALLMPDVRWVARVYQTCLGPDLECLL